MEELSMFDGKMANDILSLVSKNLLPPDSNIIKLNWLCSYKNDDLSLESYMQGTEEVEKLVIYVNRYDKKIAEISTKDGQFFDIKLNIPKKLYVHLFDNIVTINNIGQFCEALNLILMIGGFFVDS